MKAFDELLEVATRLNGPGGCPWDQTQDFFSLQPYVLEEAHEVVEAVDGQNKQEIIEELGDLLYVVIFYAKIAQRDGLFTIEEILQAVKDKLIRRHPHVFGEIKAETPEEVIKNWEEIKKGETGKEKRKSALDGIPDQMPLLTKAQKMCRIFTSKGFIEQGQPIEEEQLISALWGLLISAGKSNIDVEGALRRHLHNLKERFLEQNASV